MSEYQEFELPPHMVQQLFGGMPRLDPAQQAQVQAFQQALAAFNTEQRELTVRYAMIFCSCRKWCGCGRWHAEPPQLGCVVHSGFMLTEDGRVL